MLEAGLHVSLESRLRVPKISVGVFKWKRPSVCHPLIVVTTSRSLSGRELGQALWPWKAELCGAVWLHGKHKVAVIIEERAEPRSRQFCIYMVVLPSVRQALKLEHDLAPSEQWSILKKYSRNQTQVASYVWVVPAHSTVTLLSVWMTLFLCSLRCVLGCCM